MLRRNCAIFLSMLLTLSSIFPTSSFALTQSEQSSVESLVRNEENGERISEEQSEGMEEQKEAPFLQKKIVDGIVVSVAADPGVFPEDSILKVKKLSHKTEKKKVESAVEEKLEEDADLAESLIFDISILDAEGEEIQPDTTKGDVKVQFEQLDFLAEDHNQELAVYHMIAPDAEAEKLEDLQIDKENKSVEVSAKHFSLFVISVIDKKKGSTSTATIEQGTKQDLSALVSDYFGLSFLDSKGVKSLNEDILQVEKQGDDYFVTAKKKGTGRLEIQTKLNGVRYFDFIVQDSIKSGRIGKNIEYRITGEGNDMTLTISGYGDTDWKDGAPWRVYRERISKVIIQEGIEDFSMVEAFQGMPKLKQVYLPSTLTNIPSRAFYGSNQLGDITIPSSVKNIGYRAFVKNRGEKNKIINHSSFKLKSENDILKNLSHYNSAYTTVEQSPKAESDRIISFQFEDLHLLTVPGQMAFLELSSLVSRKKSGIHYSEVEYYLYRTENPAEIVDENTFKKADGSWNDEYKMKGRKSVFYIANGSKQVVREVQYDRNYDLSKWQAGKTYTIYILALIHEEGKDKVRKVSTPYSLSLSDAIALPGKEGEITWSIRPKNPGEFKAPFVLTIGGKGEILDAEGMNGDRPWMKVLKALDDPGIYLELQDGIRRIGAYTFESSLIHSDILIPDTVEEIGQGAFKFASIYGNIQFSKNLKWIKESAFDGCSYNGDISLPEGLTDIEAYAFYGRENEMHHSYSSNEIIENSVATSSFGTVIIPSTVQRIGEAAFYKESMGVNGKNKIINNSSIKLSERYANPLYTDFTLDDSGEESIQKPKRNDSGSSGGGGGRSSGGGGGGSSSGSGNVSFKPSNGSGSNGTSEKADWQKDSKGWWVKNEDGSYPKDEWKKINNSWYFFNQEGYMSTGWVQIKDAWYYLDSSDSENSGKMNTGWKYIGEQWYYFGTEEGEMLGKMSTGWKYISGKWYYLNPEAGANNGKMLFNTVVDGYTLGADGAWDNQAKKAN